MPIQGWCWLILIAALAILLLSVAVLPGSFLELVRDPAANGLAALRVLALVQTALTVFVMAWAAALLQGLGTSPRCWLVFEYRGMLGVAQREPQGPYVTGRLLQVEELILFQGACESSAQQQFEACVDAYLARAAAAAPASGLLVESRR